MFDDFCLKFSAQSGANVSKTFYNTIALSRYPKILQYEYSLAKNSLDAAKKEPHEFSENEGVLNGSVWGHSLTIDDY